MAVRSQATMDEREVTTVEVKRDTWRKLNMRREPGDSMDDVIRRALGSDGDESDTAIDSEGRTQAREASVELPDDLPSTVDPADARGAITAAVELLEQEKSATMREIVHDVLPQHPLGYDVPELESGDRYRGAWWRRVVKPGLEMHDNVEKPSRGHSEWRWVED